MTDGSENSSRRYSLPPARFQPQGAAAAARQCAPGKIVIEGLDDGPKEVPLSAE